MSTDAGRQRLKRGELAGRRITTRYGLGWLVNLDIAPTPAPTVATTAAPTVAESSTPAPTVAPESETSASAVSELIRLVERQQQTIMEISGRVSYLQAELANAQDTIRALQAPQKDLATDGDDAQRLATNDGDLPLTVVDTSPARRWWQRLRWGG